MREIVQAGGVFLVASGVSGAIDHVAVQPVLGVVLNLVNRLVIERLDALQGWEVVANLAVAALGLVVVLVAERIPAEAP